MSFWGIIFGSANSGSVEVDLGVSEAERDSDNDGELEALDMAEGKGGRGLLEGAYIGWMGLVATDITGRDDVL